MLRVSVCTDFRITFGVEGYADRVILMLRNVKSVVCVSADWKSIPVECRMTPYGFFRIAAVRPKRSLWQLRSQFD